ncbi:MAG: hypothetical protein SGJ27_08360 [Candidatus Melainabacteria bacterium]|nr:hypothetical protein [Candidatus Melainabacteria bacterium]
MSNDHEKSQPTERRRDAGDGTKPATSQKTATESISNEKQAKRHSENYGLAPNEKLPEVHLRDLEKRTGVANGALRYSTDGKLMLRGAGGHKDYHDGYYARESGVDTTFGKLVERPALYSIYKICGFDPCDVKVIWRNK